MKEQPPKKIAEETVLQKVERVLKDAIQLVPYDPQWPVLFEQEKEHLLSCLPGSIVRRVVHYGSTSIPDMPAKPVIDVLVEVTSLDETRAHVVPVLEAQGYDYFWRPTRGDDVPPFYAWFIKRDETGRRTHHIHMVTAYFDQWNGLCFRDYLIEFPEVARRYATLKLELSKKYPTDRVAYTSGKAEFIRDATAKALAYYAYQHH